MTRFSKGITINGLRSNSLFKEFTTQDVAPSVDDLRASYNRLYTQWLGEHRDFRQAKKALEWLGVKQGRFLDIACGLGFSLDLAELKGAEAFGLDISSTALKKSKTEKPERRLVLGNGENLPWPDNYFEYIICLGSLEHFIRPDLGVQEIARVLKPSGKAAVILPNSHHLQAIYNVMKTGSILPELQDFERFATRIEWQAFLEKNHLKVIATHKYNTGFGRIFKKGREFFWYLYNILFRLFGDIWIPLNLSFALTYICVKDVPEE